MYHKNKTKIFLQAIDS